MTNEERLTLIDKTGQKIELTDQQVDFLRWLGSKEEKHRMPPKVTAEAFKRFDPEKFNEFLERQQEEAIAGFEPRPKKYTHKKFFITNMHGNSDEFKNLGNMHTEKRDYEYPPHENREFFSPKPLNVTKYDFSHGGLSFNDRVPENYFGRDMQSERKNTDKFN